MGTMPLDKNKSWPTRLLEALRLPDCRIRLPLPELVGLDDVILIRQGEPVSLLKLILSSEPLLLEGNHTLSFRKVGRVLTIQLTKQVKE
jgi:hypothetical protein